MATESFYQDMVIDTNEAVDALTDLYEKDLHFKFSDRGRAPPASEEFLFELSDYMKQL